MATTVSARRCAELIARYRGNKNSKEPSFTTQFNAVFHLLGRLRLSRHNCILCGKFINEMADTWIDRDQLEMIESLRERHRGTDDRGRRLLGRALERRLARPSATRRRIGQTLHLGADEEAARWLQRSIEANRNMLLTHLFLAAAFAHLGRLADARSAVQAGLPLAPGFTITRFRGGAESDNPVFLKQRERICEGMRLAGVPEG